MGEIVGGSMADAVYVDCAEGIKRMMNNAKLYVKLLAKFRDGTKIDGLEAAFAEGDLEKFQGEVHTLKGLAGNLSLLELSKQCLDVEIQAKSGAVDPDQMAAIKAAFAATLLEIEKVINENT